MKKKKYISKSVRKKNQPEIPGLERTMAKSKKTQLVQKARWRVSEIIKDTSDVKS